MLNRRRLSRGAMVLYLTPQGASLLRLDAGRPLCVAKGDAAIPQGHPAAAALLEQARKRPGAVYVVLGCPDQHFAYDVLLAGSRSKAAVAHRLHTRFPDAGLRTAERIQLVGQSVVRTAGAADWPELHAWLVWLGDLHLALDGPYLLASLLVDSLASGQAPSNDPGAAAGSVVMVARDHRGGAWIFGLIRGEIRMVRQLASTLCGGPEPKARAAALAEELTRTRDWLLVQDYQAAHVPTLVTLDEPEVCALLSETLQWPAEERPAQRLRAAGTADLPAEQIFDAALLAAICARTVEPAACEPAQWAPRRRIARRSRAVAGCASALLAVAACAVGWRGWAVWQEEMALRQAMTQLHQQQVAAESRIRLGAQRSAEMTVLAAGQDIAAFEQRALAYRNAMPAEDRTAAQERLLEAATMALAGSAARAQSLDLSWDAKAKAPVLALAIALPPGQARALALGEVRDIANRLQTMLAGYVVSVTGLDHIGEVALAGQPGNSGLVTLKVGSQR